MRIVVTYKWTCDPEEATVRADGTVDWSRAKPGISTYDPVAMELARRLADAAGAELIGLTAGGKGVGTPIAAKAALSRGLDRVVIIEDESLREAGRSELGPFVADVGHPVEHVVGGGHPGVVAEDLIDAERDRGAGDPQRGSCHGRSPGACSITA